MVTLQRRRVQSSPNRVCRAFSLIELLVVVAILALLVAILGPSLNKTMMHARATKCATNLRRISEAVISRQTREPNAVFFAPSWQQAMLPYVDHNEDIYVCTEYADDDEGATETALTELVYFQVKAGNNTYQVELTEGTQVVKLNESQFQQAKAAGWLSDAGSSDHMPRDKWKYIDDGTGVYWLCMEDFGSDMDYKDVMTRVTDRNDGTTELLLTSGFTGHRNSLMSKIDNSEIVYIGSRNQGKTHAVETGSAKTSYGMNMEAPNILKDGSKMLVMDYNWIVARASHDWSKQEGEIKGVPNFARHMGKMNVLLAGQEVIRMSPDEVDPGDSINMMSLWMP